LVTIGIGCYNHSRFVEECLESVRAQTYPNLQVIIWDDVSKDNSVELIERFLKKHSLDWQFLPHKKNIGICASLNEVLSLARGKYFSMVAADDALLPEKTAAQVAILENEPADVGVVYTDAWQFDEHGTILPQRFIEAHRAFDTIPDGDIQLALFESNFIPAMSTLIRKEVFDKVGLYDTSLSYEDWDMWIRIARAYKFRYSPTIAAKYRIVQTSMSRTMRPELAKSTDDMRLKYLREGWLPASMCADAVDVLRRRAIDAYRNSNPNRGRLAIEAFRRSPTLGTLSLAVCSALGIPYTLYAFAKKTAGRSENPADASV
jgi:glycosyltransferase involved in cell wall biosynthesis